MQKEERRIEVEVFTRSPLLYGLCPSCNNLLRMNKIDFHSRQLNEYPDYMTVENAKVADLLNKLISRFSGKISLCLTNITTPGGFLRSIRKRVWRTPAFIVDGKKKIIGIPDEAELLESTEAVLAPRIMV